MTKTPNEERRTHPPKSDEELYQTKDMHSAMSSERRTDELDRLREAHEQRKLWMQTIIMTSSMVMIFIILAAWGYFNG